MKQKGTLNFHFGFGFTAPLKLSLLMFFLKVTIQPKRRGLSTVILGWFYLLKSELFDSRSSMKVNRTFKYNFGCASTTKSKFASDCCFESRNSTKMERTLDCHFSFGFTPKTKLSLLMIFLSQNSIKTKRTLICSIILSLTVKRKHINL